MESGAMSQVQGGRSRFTRAFPIVYAILVLAAVAILVRHQMREPVPATVDFASTSVEIEGSAMPPVGRQEFSAP